MKTRDDDFAKARAILRRRFPTARLVCDTGLGDGVAFTWNGKRTMTCGGPLREQWLHDIAHVLVAPAERVCLPECGLGPDPYRSSSTAKRAADVSYALANSEERLVCDVQWILAAWLGWSTKEVEDEVNIEIPSPSGAQDAIASISHWFTKAERLAMHQAWAGAA